jgi:hypothetical protein
MGIVTAQAIKVGQTVTPWVQEQIAQPGEFHELLSSLPFYDKLVHKILYYLPLQDQDEQRILERFTFYYYLGNIRCGL